MYHSDSNPLRKNNQGYHSPKVPLSNKPQQNNLIFIQLGYLHTHSDSKQLLTKSPICNTKNLIFIQFKHLH